MNDGGGVTRRQRRPLLSDDDVSPGTFKVEVQTLDGKKKRRTCGWITSKEHWGDWEDGGGSITNTPAL